jgi:hypothetical protein
MSELLPAGKHPLTTAEIDRLDSIISKFRTEVLSRRDLLDQLDVQFPDLPEVDRLDLMFTGYVAAQPDATKNMVDWSWVWYPAVRYGCGCGPVLEGDFVEEWSPTPRERPRLW